jgi:hypothetical protein
MDRSMHPKATAGFAEQLGESALAIFERGAA